MSEFSKFGAGRSIPRAAEIDAPSFNRVGNAPRVKRRGVVFRRTTRGALPTRLNEAVLTARGIYRRRDRGKDHPSLPHFEGGPSFIGGP